LEWIDLNDLAHVRHRQSNAGGHRALPGDDDHFENGAAN